MRSHTIPHRLLKQFAYKEPLTKSLRLWKYAKGIPPNGFASPRTATRVEGHFANPSDSKLEAHVEASLAREIEEPVNRFISRFSEPDWSMNDSQVKQMTRYVNLLFNRCMARRAATKHTQEITAYALNKFLTNDTQLFTVATHWNITAILKGTRYERLFTMEDVAIAARKALARNQTESARQEGFVENIVTAMTNGYPAEWDKTMREGSWNVLRTTDDDPFILSDTPVVTWERLGGGFSFGVGFARPNLEILLPISPLACLHILPSVKRTRPCIPPTTAEVNIAQAAFAHLACFANQNKKEIDDLVQNNIHKVQLGRNAFTLWHRNFDEMFCDVLMRLN